jgi:TonB family protein
MSRTGRLFIRNVPRPLTTRLFNPLSRAACALACLALLATAAHARQRTNKRGGGQTASQKAAPPPTLAAPVYYDAETVEHQRPEIAYANPADSGSPYVGTGGGMGTGGRAGVGPGTGGGVGMGMGSGAGGGVGDGGGYGPGRGYNTGGGDRNIGGGGSGGGPVDYTRPFKPAEVTKKAIITSMPEPGFTEEARNNNIYGTVRLRAVLNASGAVTNITVVKGLPDGLTEKAIMAARKIKFTPAQKDGRAVSQYVTLEYTFNPY